MDATKVKIELIPIFEDNYVFVISDLSEKKAIVIDPGEATATAEYLKNNGLALSAILLTHHHNDHIGGALDLQKEFGARVYAPVKNRGQIPFADEYVKEGDVVDVESMKFSVMELPGHTLGHVAFWNADRKWLFSGDVMFGLGCGRLFEGTPEQAFASFQRIKALPEQSLVFCAHEYTEANLSFCKMLGNNDNSPILGGDEDLELYENELVGKRGLSLPSVPLKLFIENKVNPFLLAKDVAQFAYLRDLRNKL